MRLFVISEYYIEHHVTVIFGVADSVERAKEMLDKHYGTNRGVFLERTYPEGAWMLSQTFMVMGAFNEPFKIRADITEFYLNKTKP